MNIRAYLDRINYHGPWGVSEAALYGLHAAHLYSVPFENLSVSLKEPVRLNPGDLYEKIVRRRRGGFCYELNGLFGALLETAGFRVEYLSARVFSGDGRLGAEFDHLTLRVVIPEQPASSWLADVGFGDLFIEPLILAKEGEQRQGSRAYRIEADGEDRILWQCKDEGVWERQYYFTLTPRLFPQEFEPMCVYHQTSPASSFTRQRVCTLATPEGRITLDETRLITTISGLRSEENVAEVDRAAVLRAKFGIVLNSGKPGKKTWNGGKDGI
jgi:N-hydroxyarylamine O-acetyltransferase